MTGKTEFFSIRKKPKVKLLSPQFIYAKLLAIYSFVYTIAFVIGCFLFHSLNIEPEHLANSKISGYFSASLAECNGIYDYIDLLLKVSAADISHLIIIFSAGFTMLTGLLVSAVYIFRGFSFGFSISYLTFALQNGFIDIKHPYTVIAIYSVLYAVIAVLLIHFGVKTACFSDEFKALCGRPSMIIKSKAVYLHFLRFLIAFGAILLINLTRCLF